MASKPDQPLDETCQQTTSAANQIIANSSCDLSSENNVTLRSSIDHHASNDVVVVPKVSSGEVLEDKLTSKADIRRDSEGCKDSEESVSGVNEVKPSSQRLDCSGVPSTVHMDSRTTLRRSNRNLKVKTEEDCGKLQGKEAKPSEEDDQVEKSKEFADLEDMQDPPPRSASSDECEDSDIVEQDVKVCDICGDAGREDMLAICSKCSDGAEHTYCMREMLPNLPEGYWLCEECKMAEETEKQKQGSDIEGKRIGKSFLGRQLSGKRPADDMEVAPASKKPALESGKGTNISTSKVGVLSRDNSFKHIDKGKIRSSHQASLGSHFGKISSDGGSSNMSSQINKSKGFLSKSSSFNSISKPKVKLVDEVPHKQKGYVFPDKEGRARAIGKSISFKSVNSDRPNFTESKVKPLSSKSIVHDVKGLKGGKEHNSFEKKRLSRLDRPLMSSTKSSASVSISKAEQKLTPRGENALLSSATNNREVKAVQSDGKLIASSKSASHMARKGSDTAVTPAGSTSTNGEKRMNQNTTKDEPSSSSSLNSEKAVKNGDRNMHDGLPRSRESTSQGDRGRENSFSRSKQSGTSSRTITAQKSRDVGYDAEACSLGSPRACGFDSSGVRHSGEDINSGNKLKAAITAAMLKKPGIYMKRQLERSQELATLNVEVKSAAAVQDRCSPPNMISTDVTPETLAVSQSCRNSDSYKVGSINNAKHPTGQLTETPLSSKMADIDTTLRSNGKPVIKDFSPHVPVPSVHLKITAIPEHEYIWQGAFEVLRAGKLTELCGAMQAHLSISASPKVVEAVNKFPQKILFNEVPRLSTWPAQFHKSGAKEDNIALYFFAKDIESYERSYKGMVENMIKNDLALKGDINGVELLIFPSNQLPESSRLWNRFFFLWGVFRGRRVIGLDQTTDFSKNLPMSTLNVVHLDKNVSTAVLSYSENVCSSKLADDNLPHGKSHNVVPVDSSLSAQLQVSSSGTKDGDCAGKTSFVAQKNKNVEAFLRQQDSHPRNFPRVLTGSAQSFPDITCSKPDLNETSLQECKGDAEFQPSTEAISESGVNKVEKMPVHLDTLRGGAKIIPVGNEEVDVTMSAAGEKMVDSKEGEGSIYNDALKRTLDLRESNGQQYKQNYPHTVLTALHASGGSNQSVGWKCANNVVAEGESPMKKLKSGFTEMSVYANSRVIGSFCDKGSTSSTEESSHKASDLRCASKDLIAAERPFFPLESACENDLNLRDDTMQQKAREAGNERLLGGFPNLELALGADAGAPHNLNLPAVSTRPDDRNKDKPPDMVKEEEEDVSASLSLSLSFPFSDKEQAVRPSSNAEQIRPEKRHVNTSFLLFGAPRET